MTKTWYPVVDYLSCTECGSCVSECLHGVYDKGKAPSPVVQNPYACIDHCHYCGNRCPAAAIAYVGDDTGWMPPHVQLTEEACCSCGCSKTSGNKVLVEYLYLDLKTCDRCIGTDNVLDDVIRTLTPALLLAGYEVEYHKVKMETADLAKEYRFLSSPTIRVNGLDICLSVKESNCNCCSDISGTDVDCRVFEYLGEDYDVPPKEMLAETILQTVFRPSEDGCSCGGEYRLPDNLITFFEGKKNKSGCSCGGNCCL